MQEFVEDTRSSIRSRRRYVAARFEKRKLILKADISHASLKTICVALNKTLLAVLKDSLHLKHRSNVEPERLWRVSNGARDDAIRTLMDLHQRVMVRAQIPRPLRRRRSSAQVSPRLINSNAPDSLRVSHPPPPRPEVSTNIQEPTRRRPEADLAPVPFRPMNTATRHSGFSSRVSSSLSLRSAYLDASPSISARFRDSVSTSLALPILADTGGKTAADLLREWKDDINVKLSSVPQSALPQSSGLLGPFHAQQKQNLMRHSSAPLTPAFSERSFGPIRESHLEDTMPRPGLQYDGNGMIVGQRHRSDSYVPKLMGTPRTGSTSAPITNLESGFTHRLPSKSAKASADEFFSVDT